MTVRFSTFPRTQTPPAFIADVVAVFEHHSGEIGTARQEKGLTSDEALAVVRPGLVGMGFEVEAGKRAGTRSGARFSSARMRGPISSTRWMRGTPSGERDLRSRPGGRGWGMPSIAT